MNPTHMEPVTVGDNVRRGLVPFLAWQRSQDKASRLHCDKGHAYKGNAYFVRLKGATIRVCKTCHSLYMKQWRLRRQGRPDNDADRRHLKRGPHSIETKQKMADKRRAYWQRKREAA